LSTVSAASSIARAWEEYPVDKITLVHTPGTPEEDIRKLEEWSLKLLGSRENISRLKVDSSPESLIRKSRDVLLEKLREHFQTACEEGGLVLVSSGSRRLASAASLAGVGGPGECSLNVVHVHFYFGPWSGLPYPYTPFRLQPLIVLHKVDEPKPRHSSAAGKFVESWNEPTLKNMLGSIPPIRAAMAELARRINRRTPASFILPSSREPSCGKLIINVPGHALPAADLCHVRDVSNLAEKLAGMFMFIEENLGIAYRSLLAWTGLAHLKAGENGMPFPSLLSNEKTVIDSSLIYYGAHRYFWEFNEIYIPECAIREIHMAATEAIKTRRSRKWEGLPSILAYLSLKDMIDAGAPILPTTPGYCDTAIPKIDPVILEGKVLATSDSGALRYWKGHPVRKIVKDIIQVYFDPEESLRQKVDPVNEPLSLSRLYYSIYQSILAISLLDYFKLLDNQGKAQFYVEFEGERQEIRPPIRHLVKAIGFS
jgi:hypothetical protein